MTVYVLSVAKDGQPFRVRGVYKHEAAARRDAAAVEDWDTTVSVEAVRFDERAPSSTRQGHGYPKHPQEHAEHE